MNGAFIIRVFGPSLPQAGLYRTPTIRSVAVNARRTLKIFEEPVEEALAPAADISPAAPKRSRKPRAVAVAEEDVAAITETEVAAPANRSRRRKAVEEDQTHEAANGIVEAKPKRSPRKKSTEAVIEDDGQTAIPDEAGVAGADGFDFVDTATKPKRASRKKAVADAADDRNTAGEDGVAAATCQPRAKRASKKSKEPETPDVVSTRSRRKVAEDPDNQTSPPQSSTAEEEATPPTAAAVLAKRRGASRRGGSGKSNVAARTADSPLQSELSKFVIQRNESGDVVAINRAALGMGRKMWYAIGVTAGMERKWAEQLRQKLVSNESTMVDPDTGASEPISSLITPWVPVRRDWVISKKTGNVIQRDVVHKEGWVYVNAPLDEQLIRIVEECYGFQQWRGEEDHFFDDVGAVKLITPLSEEAIEELRDWEKAPVEEQMDEAKREELSRQMFGDAGGDVLGRNERREEREGETELDEKGRVVFRNSNFTGSYSNPSNWYAGTSSAPSTGSAADADADAEADMVSLDGRGNELAYAPEPQPKKWERRQGGPRETREFGRDRRQGQNQEFGIRQAPRQESGFDARGREAERFRTTSVPPPPPQSRQLSLPPVPSRAGVRPSAAPQTPVTSSQIPALSEPANNSDLVLKFEDEEEAPASAPARGFGVSMKSAGQGSGKMQPPKRFKGSGDVQDKKEDDYEDFDEETDAVGRIDGPSGGLDMDEWFDTRRAADGAGTAAGTAGRRQVAAGGVRSSAARARPSSGYGKFVDPNQDDDDGVDPVGKEFDREGGAYMDDDEFGSFGKQDFADFDFDLMGSDDGLGASSTRRGGGGATTGGRRGQQQPTGKAHGSTDAGRRTGAAPSLDDDFFDDLSFDYMKFDDEGDALASTSRGGGGGGGYLGDFGGLDDDMWGDFGSSGRRGGTAGRGSGYGAAAGGKLGKGSGLDADNDLFGAGDDDDWGYMNAEDGGGFGGFGDADPFDLDADPWGGGGGFGRQSRGGGGRGGRSGGYQSGSRTGGGGGGYMSGSGPNYNDDVADPVSLPGPNADKSSQGQGQGYRGGGGGFKQGGGRGNSWQQQGGSGYGKRGYQGGGGGGGRSYERGGEGRNGGRGDVGGRWNNGSYGGYGQQRRNGGGGGRGGGWQDRRGGGPGGSQGAPPPP